MRDYTNTRRSIRQEHAGRMDEKPRDSGRGRDSRPHARQSGSGELELVVQTEVQADGSCSGFNQLLIELVRYNAPQCDISVFHDDMNRRLRLEAVARSDSRGSVDCAGEPQADLIVKA